MPTTMASESTQEVYDRTSTVRVGAYKHKGKVTRGRRKCLTTAGERH